MLCRDADEAAAFLESVHNLHDAFISRFTLTSRDRFEIEDPQAGGGTSLICTGQFDAEMHFEQDPAIDGPPARPSRAIILFRDVADAHIDLRGLLPSDWALDEVRIEPDRQPGRLMLICVWDRCAADGEWRRHEAALFTFSECEVLPA